MFVESIWLSGHREKHKEFKLWKWTRIFVDVGVRISLFLHSFLCLSVSVCAFLWGHLSQLASPVWLFLFIFRILSLLFSFLSFSGLSQLFARVCVCVCVWNLFYLPPSVILLSSLPLPEGKLVCMRFACVYEFLHSPVSTVTFYQLHPPWAMLSTFS